MADRICITGGSGFVGSAVIESLLAQGFDVSALVNQSDLSAGDRMRIVKGGLFNASAVDNALDGCRALIHLVGIIEENPKRGVTFERMHVEGTRSMIEAARRKNVTRYIQMSATGTRANAASHYHQTKWRAEELVRASGLEWTIFRPSLIYGPKGEFTRMLARWARKQAPPFFFMPYFGAGLLGTGGAGRLQPIDVRDVARAFVESINKPTAIGQTYCLGGPETLSWPELHVAAAETIVGKRRLTLAIPTWYAKVLTAIVPALLLPFNRDQVTMSQEDSVCDMRPFLRDFGWVPKEFVETLREYAREQKL